MQELVWVGNKIKILNHVPEWKVRDAVTTVHKAFDGELKFKIDAFRPVKNYKVRTHLISKWKTEHAYDNMHDAHTMKLWQSNLNKLRNALKLLYSEGIIDGYHVSGSGRLTVRWFKRWVQPVRELHRRIEYEERLIRADVYAEARNPYVETKRRDCEPKTDPYHAKYWRILTYKQTDRCIISDMTLRKSYADVLRIIQRAYIEYDLDTLHAYGAPLSCPMSGKPKDWATCDFDSACPEKTDRRH